MILHAYRSFVSLLGIESQYYQMMSRQENKGETPKCEVPMQIRSYADSILCGSDPTRIRSYADPIHSVSFYAILL